MAKKHHLHVTEATAMPVMTVFWRGEDLFHECGGRLEYLAPGIYYCRKQLETIFLSQNVNGRILTEDEWLKLRA